MMNDKSKVKWEKNTSILCLPLTPLLPTHSHPRPSKRNEKTRVVTLLSKDDLNNPESPICHNYIYNDLFLQVKNSKRKSK